MLSRHWFLSLLVIAASLSWSQTARSAQQQSERQPITVKNIDDSLDSDWFGIYFQGQKIGYFNTSRAKVEAGGKTLYREKLYMTMKLQSLGEKSEMKIDQTSDFEGHAPFRLQRADYVRMESNLRIKHLLVAKDKKYEATITVGKVEQKKSLIDIDYTLADSMAMELWLKRNPKKGDKITTPDLEMEDLKMELSTATLMDAKEALINGVKVTFFEVQNFSHRSNITSDSKYDARGHLISGTIGGAFELRKETEAEAKNTQFSADLFLQGLAKIDRKIGDTASLTGLILEIKGKDGPMLPDGPRQTLKAKGKDTYVLSIGKKYGTKAKATEIEIKEALEETTAYPIGEAAVKALAKKAVGDAKTDEDKAKNICKFVKDYIDPSLAATLPKMHDLMEKKSGDCKSYALMFTCLCRAVGLPSREVSGFVYMGDDIKAFGGHAWNEVLLDGYWVPVDATLNQVDCDPTHICLGTDKESANNLLKTFGKLNFKLLDVQNGN